MKKRGVVNLLSVALCISTLSVMGCKKEHADSVNPASSDPDGKKQETALTAQGYTKVFEDDFSTNLSKWDIWTGGAYNNELQYYQAANLKIANGYLAIAAKKQTVTGAETPGSDVQKTFNYTSGRAESKTSFTPTASAPKVRISASIKLPAGYGNWPAFWTYGEPWPTHGEIDILEALGQDPYTYTTDYFYGATAGEIQTNDELTVKTITSPTDLTTSFHTYEVEWTKNSLVFYLDGKVVDNKVTGAPGNEFIARFYGKLQHVALNNAIGGDNFGDDFDPSQIKVGTMYVDWVKVYTSR